MTHTYIHTKLPCWLHLVLAGCWISLFVSRPPSLAQVYDVLEELGRGSFGRVVRARHKATDTIVAVKILETHTQRQCKSLYNEVCLSVHNSPIPCLTSYRTDCCVDHAVDRYASVARRHRLRHMLALALLSSLLLSSLLLLFLLLLLLLFWFLNLFLILLLLLFLLFLSFLGGDLPFCVRVCVGFGQVSILKKCTGGSPFVCQYVAGLFVEAGDHTSPSGRPRDDEFWIVMEYVQLAA